MTPETFRREVLDGDWTETDLRSALELARAWEQSNELREQLRQLDRVRAALRAQPDGTEVPRDGWAAFEQRLMARVPHASLSAGSPALAVPRANGGTRWHMNWRITAVTLAAACLALVVVIGWNARSLVTPTENPTAASNPTATPRRVASMTPQEVAQQGELFERVAQSFDGRAKWVAVSEHRSDLGLVTRVIDKPRVLLLRLVVRSGGAAITRSDLAIVAGQEADLTLPLNSADQQVRYRIATVAGQPTRLSLSIEVLDTAGNNHAQTTAALSTELLARPGELLSPGKLRTASGEYQFEIGFFEVASGTGNAVSTSGGAS